MVQTEEIRRTLHHFYFLWFKSWQSSPATPLHVLRVFSPVDGISKPAELPINSTLLGRKVVIRIREWLFPIHVEANANRPLLLSLEMDAVTPHGPGMCQDHVVCREVRLR